MRTHRLLLSAFVALFCCPPASAQQTISGQIIRSGTLPQSALGTTGTATATNFLRGDYSWGSAVTSVGLSAPSWASVSGSPVTSSGTIALTLPTFGASGGSHAPGIVPDPGATSGTTHFLREDGAWAVPAGGGGGGGVSSVGLSLPSFITVTGSPVTSSGTLTGALATQSASTALMGPTPGSTAAAPTFRQPTPLDGWRANKPGVGSGGTLNTANAYTGSSLKACYIFNEGSGTTGHDLSGNANNLSVGAWGAGDYVTGGCLSNTPGGGTQGNVSGSVDTASSTTANNIETYSIVCVYRASTTCTNTGNISVLIAKRGSSGGFPYEVGLDCGALSGSKIGFPFVRWYDGTTIGLVEGTARADDASWHTIIASRTKSGAVKLYMDGVLVASGTDTGGSTTNSASVQIAGSTGSATFGFSGLISNVYLFNTALSDGGVSVGSLATGDVQEMSWNAWQLFE